MQKPPRGYEADKRKNIEPKHTPQSYETVPLNAGGLRFVFSTSFIYSGCFQLRFFLVVSILPKRCHQLSIKRANTMIININKDSSHSSNFTCDSCPLDALLNVSQAELEAHAPLLLTLHKP